MEREPGSRYPLSCVAEGSVGRPLARLVAIAVLASVMLVADPESWRAAVAAQTVCPSAVALTNGDFEQPVISNGSVSIMSQTNVPGWLTTATDKMIELWRGFGGVPETSGAQHAELNANMVSTLYQDLTTVPGQSLRWQLSHRGRTGTDTMAVLIGPPSGVLVQQGANIADGKTAWGTYSGLYTVPAGQTTTRFAFKSVSSASTDPSFGNFLDAISFGSAACLTTTETVGDAAGTATANIGDPLTYTVTTRNDGGNPAKLAEITDALPAGTTFVPGSLRSINGSATIKPSDTAGDDTGEYEAATRTVKVRVGTGAAGAIGGTLAPGESRSISYQVTVNPSAAGATLGDDAATGYTDTLTGNTVASTSNTASIAVNAAADLAVTTALAGPAVVAGQNASYTVTAGNAGPSTATAVQLTAVVPAGLTGVTATSPGGTCSVTGAVAECDYPSLAAADSRTMMLTGAVPSAATPGTTYTLAGAVTSATYEPHQADNADSVSTVVTSSADLGVTMTYAPAVPVAGATITYTATITNQGPSTARSIVLSDPIPSGSTNVSASTPGGSCTSTSTGTIECTMASLAAATSTTVTITMTLSSMLSGAVNNAVSATAATPDPDVSNNNFSVQSAGTSVADVGVHLAIDRNSAYAGETTHYTLTVTNHGPSAAAKVSFNTVVPPGITIVRPANPFCTPNACTLPGMAPGQVITLSGDAILTDDAAAGLGQASTTVISPTTDNNAGNDTDTVTFTVLLNSDLSVSQTIDNLDHPGQYAVAGERVRDVVTVTSSGPTRAEGVLLQQAIAAGQPVPTATTTTGTCTFQGTVDAAGITADGGRFVCSRPLMYRGSTWLITFDATLPAGYTGTGYTRTATVSATSADPSAGNDADTSTIAVDHNADLDVAQSTSTPNVVASDPVQFRVTAGNSGPSEAINVVIQIQPQAGLSIAAGTASSGSYDPAAGAWRIPVMAVGARLTLDLSGTALTAGTPANVARLLSADSTDPDATDNSASSTVTVVPAASSLRIAGTATVTPAAHQTAAGVGDSIAYRYTVTNDGNVPMSQLTVSDALTGAATCPASTIAVGATMTCTSGSYTVTQADFDAQQPVYNAASVTARPQGAATASTFGPAAAIVAVAAGTPSLSVTVTAAVNPVSHAGAARLGDTLSYSYLITNDGNVALDHVAVTDTRGGTATCPSTTLAVRASMTCTIGTPSAVTQADVDAGGTIVDAVTVSGRTAGSSTTRSFGPFSAAVPVIAAAPSLIATVAATVSPSSRQNAAARDDTISYAYSVTNNGNVTMSGITVSDTLTGTATCPAPTLAVGASMTCTSTTAYRVTAADLDAGTAITDSATVAGWRPGVTSTSTFGPFSTAVPVAVAAPALAVTVNATVNPAAHQSAARTGDTIGYTFTVTNSGNVTMSAVTVTDTLIGAATCPATPLAAGATMTCTGNASYAVAQATVDAGVVIADSATATGRAPGAAAGTSFGPFTATVPVVAAAGSLSVAVTAAVSPGSHQSSGRAGDTIAYSYRVVNDGNVTMSGIALSDSIAGSAVCPATSLAVAAAMTCTGGAAYTISQARIDAGTPITDSVTVTAANPGGIAGTYGPFTSSITVTPAVPSLSLSVAGTVTPAGHQNRAGVGDTIAYQYQVTNTGNVTMTSIGVTDTHVGASTCPSSSLAVGASMTCTSNASYTVVQADIDAGIAISDAAAVSARAPGAAAVSTYATGSTTVGVAVATASLTVFVTPTVTPPSRQVAAAAGDTIAYAYLVTNNGNVTMTSVSVTDAWTGPGICPGTVLAAGASMTCNGGATYTVTQADLDTGGPVTDAATAFGQSPTAPAPAPFGPASAAVSVAPANPLLGISVAASATGTARGDTISYAYTVRNLGNVTMDHIAVVGTTAGAATCGLSTLAVGQSTACSGGAAYTITQADIDLGAPITDTAQAYGRRAGTVTDLPFGPQTAVTAVAAAAPSLTITSAATVLPPAHQGAAAAGDTITYDYTVTNTGNVTVDHLAVLDSVAGAATCPGNTLAPGGTMHCSGGHAYTTTQADIDAGGSIVADAHVHSQQAGTAVPLSYGPATATVALAAAAPAVTATMTTTVNPPGNPAGAEAGNTVTFRFQLHNGGNQTITAIAVTDTVAGPAACPATTLAVAASMTCTSSSPYAITQADVDSGGPITGTATITGRLPGAVQSTALASYPVSVAITPPAPALTVAAAASVTPAGHHDLLALNDTVAFRYTVTNTGNVTMTDITIDDSTGAPVMCAAGTLTVGATTTCTAAHPYQVTQADVDAGQPITATATVSARTTGSAAVRTFGPATVSETVAAATDSLRLTATATVSAAGHQLGAYAGDTITYQHTVINNGDTTISGITLTDPGNAWTVTCPATVLVVGASMTCRGADPPYRVTQRDIDAGQPITSTAQVTGRRPGTNTDTTYDTAATTVPVTPAQGALTITTRAAVKTSRATAADTSEAAPAAGDSLRYTYLVNNTGNVTMSSIAINDLLVGAATCPQTSLTVGATMSCTADNLYQVTQADVDAGRIIVNAATATGRAPGAPGRYQSALASVATPVTAAAPALTAAPTASWTDVDHNGRLSTADILAATIVVTNTGNITIRNIQITDLPAPVTCPGGPIAPRAQITCHSTAFHPAAGDIAAGHHTYVAKVAGSTTADNATPVETEVRLTIGTDPTKSPSPSPSRSGRPSASPPTPPTSPVGRAPTTPQQVTPPLSATGGNYTPLLLLGAILIAAGTATTALTRRTNRPSRANRTPVEDAVLLQMWYQTLRPLPQTRTSAGRQRRDADPQTAQGHRNHRRGHANQVLLRDGPALQADARTREAAGQSG